MKLLNVFVVSSALMFTQMVMSQGNWCYTDEYNQQQLESMTKEQAEEVIKMRNRIFEFASQKQEKSGVVYTIPVVVHVIHGDCAGNISLAQIQDGIAVLNEDFNRLNSDSGNTRALFKPYAGNAEIQFKLAQIDPTGGCTEGVVRVNSDLTFNADNSVKSLSFWPSNKYMNVWLVNSIEGSGTGITLGYAQFPGWGSWSTYGLVVRHDYWGRIGTSNSDGRTASHEIGHCLGLLHTFQGGCGSNCNNSGDQICDTPPTSAATFGCNTAQNTCANDANGSGSPYATSVVDQIENYMSYDACTNMFSEGQVAVMRDVLFGSFSQLTQLVSSSNLVATGTNPGFAGPVCKPIADFCSEEVSLCEGNDVKYTDNSYNGTSTSRMWSFPGGTPASSSDSVVTVVYNTAGLYNVTLTVSNSAGSTNKTRSNVVNVVSATSTYNNWIYGEQFEDQDEFDNKWTVGNPSGGKAWELSNKAAYSGVKSLFLNNYINGFDLVDEVQTPSYNLNSVKNPKMTFQVAYAKRSSTTEEYLKIYYSFTCGKSWSIMAALNSDKLKTTENPVTGDFIPKNGTEWKLMEVAIPSFVKDKTSVLFKLEWTSDGGNNIYIDDFNIRNSSSIQEYQLIGYSLYPNPANGTAFIELGENASEFRSVEVTSMSGKALMVLEAERPQVTGSVIELNTASLPSGIYLVIVKGRDGGSSVRKLVVN